MFHQELIGRGWAFPPQLGPTQTFVLTDPQNEIEQAIWIILNTTPGERVMRPTFGSRLHELVFAPNNSQTAAIAQRYVEEALKMWEPRIELIEIEVYPDPGQVGLLHITIYYEVKATHDRRSLVYPHYLIPAE